MTKRYLVGNEAIAHAAVEASADFAGVLGASEVRRADADEVRTATGFAVGGTPPFGHPEPVRTLIDPDLLDHAEVWSGAGAPDAVFRATPQELQRTARAEIADQANLTGQVGFAGVSARMVADPIQARPEDR